MSGIPTDRGLQNTDPQSELDEISFLDLAITLARHKKFLIGLPLVVGVIAAGYSLLLPDVYTATTKILPPQQSQSTASAMLAQLNILGIVPTPGIRSPNEMYVAMLKSRTVADNLIDRFDLSTVFKQERRSDARKDLAGITKISSGKDGVITIDVDDKDPKRAAILANAYVEELHKLTNELALTEAAQRRLFFERQFAQARDNLAKAEIVAKDALRKGGLALVEGQGRAMADAALQLRAQIAVKEVQIGAMQSFATSRNPDIIHAERELQSMRQQLAKLEGDERAIGGERTPTDGKGLENLYLLRNVKYYETIFELLAKQYEMAKIDEAKDAAVIQVLDKAVVPDRKSKPSRRLIVIISMMLAGIFAVLCALLSEAVRVARVNPDKAARLEKLKETLFSWGR